MNHRHSLAALILTAACTFSALSQNLVEWRGAGRTGIYQETGLLMEWPAEGPKLLWSFEGLGKGFSSVTVVGDKIYASGQTDGVGSVFAFDLAGKLLWKAEYGKEWNESFPGTRTTLVYSSGKLYMATGLGEALCMDATTGKKLWSVDMVAKFGGKVITWGIVEAPVVDDNKVYFTPGGDQVSIVALDPNSGATVWTAPSIGEVSAYCSPLLFVYKNTKYLATSFAKNLVCFTAKEGKLVWKVSQTNTYSIHPNTPLFKDGMLYSVTGYKTGGVMVKLSDDGQSVTELWRNTTLDSQIGGAVWVGNQIVGSGSMSDRSWQCLDPKTGQVAFKSTEIGKGVVIYADGLYYCYADNGELGILDLTDQGFKLKSKFRILLGTDQHWAHPVIDRGVLYLRHGNALMAYSIRK